jgi:hypothetical protein
MIEGTTVKMEEDVNDGRGTALAFVCEMAMKMTVRNLHERK